MHPITAINSYFRRSFSRGRIILARRCHFRRPGRRVRSSCRAISLRSVAPALSGTPLPLPFQRVLTCPFPPNLFPPQPSTQHITHVYHTADPIPQGACTGSLSPCSLAGFAMESRCHTGESIVFDVVESASIVCRGRHALLIASALSQSSAGPSTRARTRSARSSTASSSPIGTSRPRAPGAVSCRPSSCRHPADHGDARCRRRRPTMYQTSPPCQVALSDSEFLLPSSPSPV